MIKKLISDAKHIVLVSHIKPDADTLGSASAFYSYLLSLHKKVTFVCKSDIKKNFLVIPWVEKIKKELPKRYDLIIYFDCSAKQRSGFDVEVDINIDHHLTNTKYAKLNIINQNAISTTYVVYELFKKLEVKINRKIATALYAGLIDDSDMFSLDSVDGTTFAFAKELIEFGANHKNVVKYLQKYSTLSSLKLQSYMFLEMELLHNAKVAVFSVTKELLEKTGALEEDCEIALQKALELPTVKMSILFVEKNNADIKVSLRSFENDVLKIALKYGGGGHTVRAGCDFKNSDIDKIKEKILKEVV
jgi:phosphoesterase RecJ-like protein